MRIREPLPLSRAPAGPQSVAAILKRFGITGDKGALWDITYERFREVLDAADKAGLDAVGALAEDLIAEETKHGHPHGCTCGHHHE